MIVLLKMVIFQIHVLLPKGIQYCNTVYCIALIKKSRQTCIFLLEDGSTKRLFSICMLAALVYLHLLPGPQSLQQPLNFWTLWNQNLKLKTQPKTRCLREEKVMNET